MPFRRISSGLAILLTAPIATGAGKEAVMLSGEWVPTDVDQIDYRRLPRVPGKNVIISDVRDRAGTWVHQHAYLAHFDGRYWAMWSDGPGLPRPGATPKQHRNIVPGHDRPDTRISYATSKDGLHWSKPMDLSGPPRIKGFGWIARGLWVRDGELLALGSHFNAPGYPGEGLSLEAFRWDGKKWVAHGTVLDDSLNNFPPKQLPTGEWMMTRRDHQRQVSVMIGGVDGFNAWRISPLASYNGNGRPEEPYWYVLPDEKNIVGLIRDNGRSQRLLRTCSRDNGRTWSKMERTNFPDATSKFFVHRTSRGYYVMVSNSNPRKRDPLTLAVSADGLVFTKLFWLIGDRHIDYPHIIEHDERLMIAFSGAKQTMEVMRVALDDLEKLVMPDSVTLEKKLPPVKQPRPLTAHWIDLGDEGKTLFVSATAVVPPRGKESALNLSTASGQKRVSIGFDSRGRLTGYLHHDSATGPVYEAGARVRLLVKIVSHAQRPDELFIRIDKADWALINRDGDSAANLAQVNVRGMDTSFTNIRIAHSEKKLINVKPIHAGR
ncbi:MAG: hypothetical protein CMO80_07970 [Verrucomicrobiales bacterium]|nr:hypothetical protein [Verrucomicrobiales bacterium]